jgi:hypothetical protein
MAALRESGCDCYGIDRNAQAVALCVSKGLAAIAGDVDAFDTDPEVRALFSRQYDVVIFSKCLMYLARKNELMRALRARHIFINQLNPDQWKYRLAKSFGLAPKETNRLPYKTADGEEIEISSRAMLRRWGESYGYYSRVVLGSTFRSHDTIIHLWRN